MRIGAFSEAKLDSKMQPPVGADNPYRYRNKAQFPVGYDRDGNIVTGFLCIAKPQYHPGRGLQAWGAAKQRDTRHHKGMDE